MSAEETPPADPALTTPVSITGPRTLWLVLRPRLTEESSLFRAELQGQPWKLNMPDSGEQPTGNGVVNLADQNLDAQGTGEIGFGHKRDQRQGGRSPPFKLHADGL